MSGVLPGLVEYFLEDRFGLLIAFAEYLICSVGSPKGGLQNHVSPEQFKNQGGLI